MSTEITIREATEKREYRFNELQVGDFFLDCARNNALCMRIQAMRTLVEHNQTKHVNAFALHKGWLVHNVGPEKVIPVAKLDIIMTILEENEPDLAAEVGTNEA